jgi:hypothetical protein
VDTECKGSFACRSERRDSHQNREVFKRIKARRNWKMNYTDRIRPTDKGITTYLDELKNLDFQIPTFQREISWREKNVKKLWDSIYKFYPLGSMLVWKTDTQLQNHREIGGHVISDRDFSRSEYQYILDGQQRTTALLTSLYGGKIKGMEGDPSIYVDLSVQSAEETDDDSYKRRFLYWDEIDDKEGAIKRNISRTKKYREGVIVKLLDVKMNFGSVERKLVDNEYVDYKDYDHPVREELRRIKQVLDSYRLSFIELKGIQVSEVCQIFERINQEGKPLDIFDIVVAKTYRPAGDGEAGFYLRELIDEFREGKTSKFFQIKNDYYLQILAIIIRENIENSGVMNITPLYLNNMKTEQIETIWSGTQKAILETFDFFENILNIKGPQLVPYGYFYLTLANYFYGNKKPNYDFLKKYFWFYSFHRDDLLSNTRDIKDHISVLDEEKQLAKPRLGRFMVDKQELRKISYSSTGRLSRAVLALYSSKKPRDWKETDRPVLADNLFFSADKPNLHHIFPTKFINSASKKYGVNNDSLMNIAFLTQQTNQEISAKNPLLYMREYDNNPDFGKTLETHIVPETLLEWVRMEKMPDNALEQFMEERVDMILEELRSILHGIEFEVIDTR